MTPTHAPRGLDKPETYQADPALATLARRLAERDFATRPAGSISRGDLKREYLEGKHAAKVAAALDEEAAKAGKAKAEAEAIVAPPGYQVTPGVAAITVKGPFDEGLHASIKRASGQWDREIKGWRMPADKAASLKRIMANFAKRAPSVEEVAAQQAARKTEVQRRELLRWLGYVEEKAPSGYLYQNGLDKLKELGIDQHPDLKSRLDAAVAQVRSVKQAEEEVKAAAQRARAAEALRTDKIYLNVPYEDRERAKRHGARWDNLRRAWYVTGEVPEALQTYAGPPEAKLRRLYPLASLPALNQPVKLGNSVVVFTGVGKTVRISEEDPSVHGSQLLGHEGGQGAFAYYREATPEEREAFEQRQQAIAHRQATVEQARQQVDALRERFMSQGTRPMGMQAVEGERLLDSQNIYGGGDWWVIQPDAIWYMQNNGADGDDWSLNNVRTGGAGAIGWRMPYDPQVEQALREAKAALTMPKVVSVSAA